MRFRLLLSFLTVLPCPPLSVYLSSSNGAHFRGSLALSIFAMLIFFFVFFGPGLILFGLACGHAIIRFLIALIRRVD